MAKIVTQKELANLIKVFQQARQQLIDAIIHGGVGTKVYANTLLQQLEKQLKQMEKQSAYYVQTVIPAEYQKALDELYAYFKKNNLLMKPPQSFAQLHNDAIYEIAREMQYQIGQGLSQVGRQIERYIEDARDNALRQAGLEATGSKLASGSTVFQMRNELVKRLENEGFMTVQYSEGSRAFQVPIDVYATMVSRSTTREAGNIARENQLIANGYDLVQMTTHFPTCEICSMYQGRVYSISGKDKRFPALFDTAFKSGYRNVHPNCRHSIAPWIESMHTQEEIENIINISNQPFEDARKKGEKKLYAKQQAQNRQARRDLYQWERYKARLGEDAPKTFAEFRRIKKAGGEHWEALQEKYRLYNRGAEKGVLPYSQNAATPESKIKGYLLCSTHPVGKHKAKIIDSVLGYNESNWSDFSDKLYREVQKSPVDKVTPFTFPKNGDIIESTKYEVPVIILGEKGRYLKLKSVWAMDKGSNIPRFITASFYDRKKKGEN